MRLTQKYLIGTILCILISSLVTLMSISAPLGTFEANTVDYLVNNRTHTMDVFFTNRIKDISDKTVEYAYWDDLLMALKNHNVPWIHDNVTEYLYHSPFDIDVVYLTSNTYDYHEFYGNELLLEQLQSMALFHKVLATGEPMSSFILFDEELYIVSISPVTNNDGSLGPKGFLTIGRRVDDDVLTPLQGYIGDDASIRLVLDNLDHSSHHIISDQKHISFLYPINNFSDSTIASYEVTIDVGYFYRLKYILFRNITLIILLSVILCSFIVFYVTKKLSFQFEHSVHAIQNIADGDYSQKLMEHGVYELKVLASSINKLSSGIRQRNLKMRENYLKTIETLSTALEVKDQYTQGHSERVAKYSVAVARSLGLKDIDSIEAAALMHDIGKIGIPEYILNKNGKLTPEEFTVVQEHPEKGFRILDFIEDFHEIKYMIRYHHEWYNGKGYPHGLSGLTIPIGARIIAIADAFDAMTSHRPYRMAMSVELAVAEINKMAGTQFDPEIVDIFTQIVGNMTPEPSKEEVVVTI